MKIAIASSGLGHVARGIETWADDLGTALYRRGADVVLFKGGGTASRPFEQVVSCAQRDRCLAQGLARVLRHGGWRFGLGSPYDIEQTTFARSLIPQLSSRHIDIVHMQDPRLAYLLEKARRRGRHNARVILAHGTEESLEFLKQFEHVQELAPYYLEQDCQRGCAGKPWFAIPNFVDIERFSPDGPALSRAELGATDGEFLILTVAAIKRTHKRVDAIIEEVAAFKAQHPARSVKLVVAGARERETADVIAMGRERLGRTVTFLENFDRKNMPSLYRAADVMVHGSFVEMMPIALLEATACGLPVVAHHWPVINWIVGDGGTCVDAAQPGVLASALSPYLSPSFRSDRSTNARKHAVSCFSEDIVVEQIVDMYQQVMKTSERDSSHHELQH